MGWCEAYELNQLHSLRPAVRKMTLHEIHVIALAGEDNIGPLDILTAQLMAAM